MQTVVEKYMKAHNIKAEGAIEQLLVPFYVMDICYQIYLKEVKPKVLKHEPKKFITLFQQEYKVFNYELFRYISVEDSEKVTDRMDEIESVVHNYIMNCRIALMDIFSDYNDKDRDFMTSLLLCDLICQISSIMWTAIYTTLDNGKKGETNLHLQRMRSYIFKTCNYYEAKLGMHNVINLNDSKVLHDACTVLTNKIIDAISQIS